MAKKVVLTCLIILSLPYNAGAVVAFSFEQPDTVLSANTGIDIIKSAGGIWVATSGGVNFTFDNGRTWLLYDSSNGLVSDNLSAIFAQNNRVWAATNHSELIGNETFTLSDGLSYTDDQGDTWIQVDFTAQGIDRILGIDRQIFDIAGHYDANQNDDWLFASAFAGALLASRDGGNNWRRIYPSIIDSINYNTVSLPALRMLYFSCATDTSHGDTLYLWSGTAEGIFQYIYISPRDKPFSKSVNQISFCDNCTDSLGSFMFIGGNNGLTRGLKNGGPFISRFQVDGLPGPQVSAVIDFRDRVFVGTSDAGGTASTGLAYSDDRGNTFVPHTSFNSVYALPLDSLNNRIWDFDFIGERLYMAAEEAGLFVSLDTGLTWSPVVVDTPGFAQGNLRNVVYSLESVGDTLRVGTDSGLVQLFLDPAGNTDSSRFFVFAENVSSARRITRIRTQRFTTDSTLDSTAIWTVNQRATFDGTEMVGRSNDAGLTWDHLQVAQGVNELSRDVNFWGDTVFIVGAQSVLFYGAYTPPPTNPRNLTISDSVNTLDNLNNDLVTSIEFSGDTVVIGTDNGFAISNNGIANSIAKFKIFRVNTDSLAADAVIQFQRNPSNPFEAGITGNFIQALEVQYRGSGPGIVWASNSPTTAGEVGIAAGAVVPVLLPDSSITYERLWVSVYDNFAWNFAFNGDTVFAATNNGVIYTADTGATWDTLSFVDAGGFTLYGLNDRIIGVSVIDSFLWATGDDRILRMRLSDGIAEAFFPVDTATQASEVYAFPVPYSNVRDAGNGVTFRFVLDQDASVTIEVYDFAMNLVRRVEDNRFFAAGYYPTATNAVQWDALNGKGDRLAVGMYYFKIEISTGETRWGKLAIIP